ncbi:EamA-like transporter family protein [Candidatus Anstonella stagnisolia]|nr:EamA-like transporter family protein [Candidatus Anstonella stagnisolia]
MLEIGLALIALTAFSFAAKDIFSKNLLKTESNWAVNFYMGLTGFLLSLVWVLLSGIPKISLLDIFYAAIVGAGVSFGQYFFFKALKEGKASVVGPISCTWAVLVVIFAVLFFGQPLSIATAAGAALAFGGIFITAISQHPKVTANLIIAILIWSTWVFAAPLISNVGSPAALCLIMLFITLASIRGIHAKKPHTLLLPGIFNFIAFASESIAIPLVTIVVTSALMTPLYFLFINIGGYFLFRERLTKSEITGLLLVCAGIVTATAFG